VQRHPSRRGIIILLLIIGIVGFLLRINEAVHISNLAHPDEIYQTLEPAHRLAYGYGIVTWEWRDGIRSWLLPLLLAGVMRCTGWMGQGSDGYLLAIRLLLAASSMVTIWFGYVWAKRTCGPIAAVISAAVCACWYEIVGFAPRAMPEVLAIHVLLVGLYLGAYPGQLSKNRDLFLAGVSFGIAMSLRIQLAPAIMFAGLYLCRRHWLKRLPMIAGGIVLPVIVFGLVDLVTWHHIFQSFYLYFWENAVKGKSLLYGTKPWSWYLIEQLDHLGPVLLLALFGVRRSHLLGWIVLIIFASHSVVAHKEARFLYPALPLILVLSVLGFWEVMRGLNRHLKISTDYRPIIATGIVFFLLTSSALASSFPFWLKNSGGMTAFNQLSKNDLVCGVGLYGVPWTNVGGYTYLHKNVPIILMSKSEEFDNEAAAVNSILAREGVSIPRADFSPRGCWNGTCLYQRAGPCAFSDEREINRVLRESGN
jgi:GPI mannosyltransferase 3